MKRETKAYTLIELLVVIAIIGMMAVFAVPAFMKFGKNQTFKQKVEETALLMNQAATSAKNPEIGAKAYTVLASIAEPASFILYSCDTTDCAANKTEKSRVTLTKDQVIQCSNTDPNQCYLSCAADAESKCLSSNNWSIYDGATERTFGFSFEGITDSRPFRVNANEL